MTATDIDTQAEVLTVEEAAAILRIRRRRSHRRADF